MPDLSSRSLRLGFDRCGAGPTIVFQHGLAASRGQARELLAEVPDIDVVSLDAPGHGESDRPADPLTFDVMGDAVVALLDHLQIESVVLGGISMGAGIGLNVALRYPARVRGLALVRPAWLDAPDPPNLAVIARMGAWILADGLDAARERIAHDPFVAALCESNPRCAASITGALDQPGAAERGQTLIDMVGSAPFGSMADLARLEVPAVVIASEEDPLHPVEMATRIAEALPRAEYHVTPPRYLEPARHAAAVRRRIGDLVRVNGA